MCTADHDTAVLRLWSRRLVRWCVRILERAVAWLWRTCAETMLMWLWRAICGIPNLRLAKSLAVLGVSLLCIHGSPGGISSPLPATCYDSSSGLLQLFLGPSLAKLIVHVVDCSAQPDAAHVHGHDGISDGRAISDARGAECPWLGLRLGLASLGVVLAIEMAAQEYNIPVLRSLFSGPRIAFSVMLRLLQSSTVRFLHWLRGYLQPAWAAAWEAAVRVGTLVQRALVYVREYALEAVEYTARFGGWLYGLLCRLCNAIVSAATRMWALICVAARWIRDSVVRPAVRVLRSLSTTVHTHYLAVYFACKHLGTVIVTWVARCILSPLRDMASFAATVLSRFGHTCMSALLRAMTSFHRNFLQPFAQHVIWLLQSIWRKCKIVIVDVLIHRLLSRFSRAWWRLIPTGLAFAATVRFGLAIFRSGLAVSALVGFGLATWSVGIVALVLARDVHQRTFNWSAETNRQYVATDPASSFHDPNSQVDRLLQHVDLGLLRAAKWSVRNLGQLLSILLEHAVQWGGRALHRAAELLWRLTKLVWRSIAHPVLRQLWSLVLAIWESPVLSSLSTLGCLGLLYGHHSGIYRWVALETLLLTSQRTGMTTATQLAWLLCTYGGIAWQLIWEWSQVLGGLAWVLLRSTQAQLVAAAEAGDMESPRLAWVRSFILPTRSAAITSYNDSQPITFAWSVRRRWSGLSLSPPHSPQPRSGLRPCPGRFWCCG